MGKRFALSWLSLQHLLSTFFLDLTFQIDQDSGELVALHPYSDFISLLVFIITVFMYELTFIFLILDSGHQKFPKNRGS